MKILGKREIKIFFTFFLMYSFFVHWIGWNENSRFALVRAIVDENRIEIDTYANQTTDRSYFNDHYYSDKDPGVSLISVPIYAYWKFICGFFTPKYEANDGSEGYLTTLVGVNNVPIIEYFNPGFFILTSMILVTIFISSLFSALTVMLVYKISSYFTKKESHRLALTIIYGLGTLAFPYALIFYEHALAMFFAFFAFCLLFKLKKERVRDDKYPILAGLLFGLAVTISAVSAIIVIGSLIYLLKVDKRKIKWFIIGGFLGLTPFLIYNYMVFGIPFTLPRYYLDPKIWPQLEGIHGLQIPNPILMIRLTIYPYKGLFFYYPVLLLSVIGLFYFYKEFKIESILFVYIFLAFLILNSSWWAWWGGASFGPRHLSLTMPFLILPLISFLKKIKRKDLVVYFAFFFIILSIIINFSGLETSKEPISLTTFTFKPLYAERVNTLSILENPIYDYHIPNFIRHGSRSRIFEGAINLRIIDIRDTPLSYGRFFPIVGGFHIPFLCLLPLVIIMVVIWRTEIFEKIDKHSNKIIKIISIFLLILPILFFVQIRRKPISFELNWHEPLSNEDVRWMQQNGTISILNPSENIEKKRLHFYIKSFLEDKEIIVYLNNEIIGQFIALKQGEFVYSQIIELNPGRNVLKLHSVQGCDIPYFVMGLEDFRCLSIGVGDLILKSVGEDDILFSQNWYMGKEKWMKNNGTILVNNFDNEIKEVKFKFYSIAYHKDRAISLFLNGKLVDNFTILKEGNTVFSSLLRLNPGENILNFYSVDGCDKPSELGLIDDTRCLSVKIDNFSKIPVEHIIEENWDKTFDKNWYKKEEHENFTWMKQDGTISIYNFDNSLEAKKVLIYTRSFYKDRNVNVYLNNELIDTYEIPNKGYGEILFSMPPLLPGENSLVLHSIEGCDIVHDIEKWEDYRCLSVGIYELYLVK